MKRHSLRDLTGPFTTLGPISIWMLLFILIPLFLVLIVSFLTRGTYGGVVNDFTWFNYSRLFDSLYLKIVVRSLAIALTTTIACLIAGYPFAWFVAKRFTGWRNLLLMLVIVPFWTNSLVRTYSWIVLLRTEGILNSYLQAFGILSSPLEFLYNDLAVVLVMVYTFLPFMILPLYASLEKLDESLLEASADLGATPTGTFFRVTLPLSMPGIFAGSLLVFIPSLGVFFIPDLIGGGRYMLLSNLIKNQFLSARDWPFGSALSIVVILATLGMIFLYIRTTKSGGRRDLL